MLKSSLQRCALVLMDKHLVYQDITTFSHSVNIEANYSAKQHYSTAATDCSHVCSIGPLKSLLPSTLLQSAGQTASPPWIRAAYLAKERRQILTLASKFWPRNNTSITHFKIKQNKPKKKK